MVNSTHCCACLSSSISRYLEVLTDNGRSPLQTLENRNLCVDFVHGKGLGIWPGLSFNRKTVLQIAEQKVVGSAGDSLGHFPLLVYRIYYQEPHSSFHFCFKKLYQYSMIFSLTRTLNRIYEENTLARLFTQAILEQHNSRSHAHQHLFHYMSAIRARSTVNNNDFFPFLVNLDASPMLTLN